MDGRIRHPALSWRLRITGAALFAWAVLLTGCGGDGSSAEAESDAAAKAAFVNQANAVCVNRNRKTRRKLEAYRRKNPSEGAPQNVVFTKELNAVTLPAVEAQVTAIKKLKPPAADKKEIDGILVAQEEAVIQLQALDVVRFPGIVGIHFDKPNKALESYGLEACAVR